MGGNCVKGKKEKSTMTTCIVFVMYMIRICFILRRLLEREVMAEYGKLSRKRVNKLMP